MSVYFKILVGLLEHNPSQEADNRSIYEELFRFLWNSGSLTWSQQAATDANPERVFHSTPSIAIYAIYILILSSHL
jgi:hypothetical protein